MAKAFWKGVISFGLVVIPVKMSVAAESKTISFHMLHRKCHTRPKQVYYCQADDEYLEPTDIVRGYEYAKDQFAVLDESDFEKVLLKTLHAIDITGFVSTKEIDPLYYRGSHYVEPEELGAKPFSLLRQTLVDEDRVGIAKVAFQRREHLCCLRPLGDIMALHALHYEDEVRSYPKLEAQPTPAGKQEKEMAASLVKAMAMEFKPGQYRDEYRTALRAVIEAKLAGKKLAAVARPKAEAAPDLMSALKASVEAAMREALEKGRPQRGARVTGKKG